MWQCRIIIEISSRKELLGPIWSFPPGPSQHHSLQRPPPCFVQAVGECLGDAILRSDFHSTLGLILELVSIQPSAWSLYFMHCRKKDFLAKTNKSHPVITLSVSCQVG